MKTIVIIKLKKTPEKRNGGCGKRALFDLYGIQSDEISPKENEDDTILKSLPIGQVVFSLSKIDIKHLLL